jgi:hypothetical protein
LHISKILVGIIHSFRTSAKQKAQRKIHGTIAKQIVQLQKRSQWRFPFALKTIHNVPRTLVHTNPPCNMIQARDIIDEALATEMHAMQTTIATTVGSTPGSLAFAQYMFLKLPLITDWQAITHACEYHVK